MTTANSGTKTLVGALLLLAVMTVLCGCEPSGLTAMRWESTDGPYAQNIAVVMPDIKSRGTLYAGLKSGELQFSTNDGKTWSRLSSVPAFRSLRMLLQDPDQSERFFAATDSGAYRSTDGGKTWFLLPLGDRGTGVQIIAVDPWAPRTMYAGTEGRGIYRSTDGGDAWIQFQNASDPRYSTGDVYAIVVDPAKPNTVYGTCTGIGIIRSSDGGSSWGSLTDDPSTMGGRATHLILKKGRSDIIVYGTNVGNIRMSTNGGQTWISSRIGEESDRIISLSGDPVHTDRIVVGTEFGVIVSTDFGLTWNPDGGALPKVPTAIVLSSSGVSLETYAYGSGIGLQASLDDGRTWHPADRHLGGATVRSLTTNPEGNKIYAATGSTCLTTTISSPGEWHTAGAGIVGGAVRSVTFDPALPTTLYAATASGIFSSNDGGNTWRSIARSLRMSPVMVEPHPTIKTRMFATSEKGLYVSTDRGSSWMMSKPLANQWQVRSMSFSPTNAGVIVAATAANGVLATTDGGFNWEPSRFGLPATPLSLVTFDDKDPDVLYAFTENGGSYRSTNKGLEWNFYAPPWTNAQKAVLSCDREQPNSVVALINNKSLYFSSSGGGTWFLLTDQKIPAEVIALHWNAAAGIIVAGTVDKGVYWISVGARIRELLEE
jgi:photosystem II stability/assembly factor-like uncharacterized protein